MTPGKAPFPHAMARLAVLAALCLGALPPAAARAAPEAQQETGSTRSLYMLLIQQARSDGRPRAALAYLADFDRQYPGDLDARILRVNCLLDLGQVDQARAALAAIPAGSRNGKASLVRGHVRAAEGDWEAAIGDYAAALRADPADPLTGNALGYAQLRTGRAALAVETLKAALDLAPGNAVIRNNLLLALTMAGRADEAEASLRAIRDAGARARLRGQIAEQSERLAAARGGSVAQEP
ncbi:tetratricopeptide repeat protein [Novosphingobium album (ex Liu et al. 2023)]|uniref:Tetratricopeptide repeat protein n=1 Tax=Novosphingobium album (ex Liu et al. 2023) TaxID=3031130 RepID=A0ABT5WKS1_9SPHN|nr:tetratricopeptide repeat protein [Novosphingobium album (ex Liu et al. 2023)]MDE8650504.1 tetratricopeptide repeat protein [Novosphingobium album (ex Liu et al. 2023)]